MVAQIDGLLIGMMVDPAVEMGDQPAVVFLIDISDSPAYGQADALLDIYRGQGRGLRNRACLERQGLSLMTCKAGSEVAGLIRYDAGKEAMSRARCEGVSGGRNTDGCDHEDDV